MLTITIDRTSLGLLPLTINDTTGSTYTLMPGFDVGIASVENTIVESQRRDGGTLTSSRRKVTAISGEIRVDGGNPDGLKLAIATLAEALGQFSYTVTVAEGTNPTTYTCMPADWKRTFDQVEMRINRDLVTVTIPRQP